MIERKIENIKTQVGKNTGYRKEQRKRYAERIRKQKPEKPGELIQIDHMVLNHLQWIKN